MASDTLTGSRIRERRVIAGLKQADLAREAEISASYLNLIEHNRRRIGGKVLLKIAAALRVDPSVLTEGAEAQLLAGLRSAADAAGLAQAERSRVEEFAGRFPGWASLLAATHQKTQSLERTVKSLSDRLAHDPDLAASMHEILTTAAAIRATAAILAEDQDLDPTWLSRFHDNINADSQRLAESSKALVRYFDAETEKSVVSLTPDDEFEAFLEAHRDSFPELEAGKLTEAALIAAAPELRTDAARDLARAHLKRVTSDAAAMPRTAFAKALIKSGPDPIALAHAFAVPVASVLRRMAVIPDLDAGLVISDRAGRLLVRQRTRDFEIPRFGAPPGSWPLFEAITTPGHILSRGIEASDDGARALHAYATAEVVGTSDYNRAPPIEATMLVLPVAG